MHHPYGPSSLYRRKMCPASYELEINQPEANNADADAGTNNHAIISDAFKKGIQVPDTGNKHVDNAISFAASFISEGYNTELRHIEWEMASSLISGTPDYFSIAAKAESVRAFIIDWKTGYVAGNIESYKLQLSAYAHLVFENFRGVKTIFAVAYGTERGEMLFEPLIFKRSSNDDVRIAKEISDIITFDKSIYCTGDWCKYCKGRSVCPEVQSKQESAVSALSIETFDDIVQAINSGNRSPEIIAQIDDALNKLEGVGKLVLGRQDKLKDLVKTLGGTPGYSCITTKQGIKVDYKAAFTELAMRVDNAALCEEIMMRHSEPSGGVTQIRKREKKEPKPVVIDNETPPVTAEPEKQKKPRKRKEEPVQEHVKEPVQEHVAAIPEPTTPEPEIKADQSAEIADSLEQWEIKNTMLEKVFLRWVAKKSCFEINKALFEAMGDMILKPLKTWNSDDLSKFEARYGL